jgi:Flp pilus assembly protein TadD
VQHHILGCNLQARGHLNSAEVRLKAALRVKIGTLGNNHPRVAAILNNLGTVYEDKGDRAEAARHYGTAAAIYSDTLGPDHPSTSVAKSNLNHLTSPPRLLSRQ